MPQTPLLDLADVELAQLIATAASLPAEKRAAFVARPPCWDRQFVEAMWNWR
jgi:hypothetical protein